jgi:hypothetical protein
LHGFKETNAVASLINKNSKKKKNCGKLPQKGSLTTLHEVFRRFNGAKNSYGVFPMEFAGSTQHFKKLSGNPT